MPSLSRQISPRVNTCSMQARSRHRSWSRASTTTAFCVIGPGCPDGKWQANTDGGIDVSQFRLDWDQKPPTCPQGHTSMSWTPALDHRKNEVIKIKFSMKDCKPCPLKEHCTKAPRRAISVRVKDHHQALQEVRARQKGAEFREKYRSRSGIEGTISKARSRLWPASYSLSGLAENPFPALGDCGSDQLGAYPGMVGWRATCQNAHFQIRCFGCLNPQVRQQYHVC